MREEIFDTEAAVLAKLRARPELSAEEEKALQNEMDRGLSLAHRELFVDALEHYQQLSERWPQVSVLHYNRAVLLEQSGRLADAKKAYRLAVGLSASNEAALENLLRLLVREQESQEAVELLAKMVESEPESLALRDKWLEMLVLAGKWELAEAEAKKVLRENERHVGAMLPLARMWHEEGKFELVRQVLENAREIEPKNAEVLNRLGVVLLELDYRSRALELFRQAAALDDALPEAHNNLGALLVEVNDCKGAIEALEAAQRKAPHDSKVRLNLGNAYRCDRRMEEAREQYQLALKLDPLLNDARFNLAILFLDGGFEELERVDSLRTSLAHFDAYRQGQGEDPRLERYAEEAQKALDREEARLARVAERERQAQERAEREAARRREEEARALAEKLARMQEIEARKVAKKSVIEDDPPPTKPVKVYRIGKIGEGK